MTEYRILVDGKDMLTTDDFAMAYKAYKSWTMRGKLVQVLSVHTTDVTQVMGETR